MSFERLRERLCAGGVSLTDEQLAEAIWLGLHVDLSRLHPRGTPLHVKDRTQPATGPSGKPTADGEAGPGEATGQAGSQDQSAGGATVTLHLPTTMDPARSGPADDAPFGPGIPAQHARADDVALGEDRASTDQPAATAAPARTGRPAASAGGIEALTGSPLRVRTANALTGTLSLLNALRPLKRRVPSRHAQAIDEEATARYVAECRTWSPVWRPVPDRCLRLTLVLDQSPVDRIWERLHSELRTLLERLGAFRTVQVWHLYDRPGGPVVLTAPSDAGGRPRRIAGLPARQENHLLLAVSDCVGDGWRSGTVGALLARWARHATVAVIQPLPEHLWPRTGLAPVQGRLRAPQAGAPTATNFFVAHRGGAPPSGALPIPVLELTSDWLYPWAALVSRPPATGIDAVVTLVRDARGSEDEPAATTELSGSDRSGIPAGGVYQTGEAGPAALLRLFRGSATPLAYDLLRYLAAAVPLNLATIRVVQDVMVPGSRPSHLAEVLYSGLLTAVPGTGTGRSGDDQQFEFVAGVRAELLRGMPRSEGWQVYLAVSRHVEQHIERVGASFSAMVATPSGGLVAPALLQPFAEVRLQVLRRLTGADIVRYPVGVVPRAPGAPEPRTAGAQRHQSGHRNGGAPALRRADDGGTTRTRMPNQVSILHLTAPRASRQGPAGASADYADRLLAAAVDRRAQGLPAPSLIVVTGNVADRAGAAEYTMAHSLLTSLRAGLGLAPERLIVVPGPRDVDQARHEIDPGSQERAEVAPGPPNWLRWESFAGLLDQCGGALYSPDRPWHLTRIASLRTVVLGLNSTMADGSHGLLGPEQLAWFSQRLEPYRSRGWLRIGLLHHDPAPSASGSGTLRDSVAFAERLAPLLDLVIHGQSGTVREIGLTGVPAVAVHPEPDPAVSTQSGGAAAHEQHRPAAGGVDPSSPLGVFPHQLINIRPGQLRVLTQVPVRRPESPVSDVTYAFGDHWWVAVRPSGEPPYPRADGDRRTHDQDAAARSGTEGSDSISGQEHARWAGCLPVPAPHWSDGARTDLVSEVAEVYRLHHPLAVIKEYRWPDGDPWGADDSSYPHPSATAAPAPGNSGGVASGQVEGVESRPSDREIRQGLLHIQLPDDEDACRSLCVGVHDGELDRRLVGRFQDTIVRQLRAEGLEPCCVLVTRVAAPDGLRTWAGGLGIRLRGLPDLQLGPALIGYAERQAAEFSSVPALAPERYVPQRYVLPAIDDRPGRLRCAGGPSGAPSEAGPGDDQPSSTAVSDHGSCPEVPRRSTPTVATGLLDHVRQWLTSPDGQVLVLLGEPGVGKTRLVAELTYRLPTGPDPVVPILAAADIDWRLGLDALISARLDHGGEGVVSADLIRHLRLRGRIILICDGLERFLPAPGDRAGHALHWPVPRQIVDDGGKLILVSRDRNVIDSLLPEADSGVGSRLRCHVTEVVGFDAEQIRERLVREFGDPQHAQARWAALERYSELVELCQDPRLLNDIICLDEFLLKVAAPDSTPTAAITELYDKLIERLAADPGPLSGDTPGPARSAPHEHMLKIIKQLAWRLWTSHQAIRDPDTFGADLLGEAADSLVRPKNADPDNQTPHDRVTASRRLGTSRFLTPTADGRSTFIHRSVLEWLVARFVADCLQAGDSIRIVNQALQRHMSPLGIDFLCQLAPGQRLRRWAEISVTGAGLTPRAHRNALRILAHFQT